MNKDRHIQNNIVDIKKLLRHTGDGGVDEEIEKSESNPLVNMGNVKA